MPSSGGDGDREPDLGGRPRRKLKNGPGASLGGSPPCLWRYPNTLPHRDGPSLDRERRECARADVQRLDPNGGGLRPLCLRSASQPRAKALHERLAGNPRAQELLLALALREPAEPRSRLTPEHPLGYCDLVPSRIVPASRELDVDAHLQVGGERIEGERARMGDIETGPDIKRPQELRLAIRPKFESKLRRIEIQVLPEQLTQNRARCAPTSPESIALQPCCAFSLGGAEQAMEVVRNLLKVGDPYLDLAWRRHRRKDTDERKRPGRPWSSACAAHRIARSPGCAHSLNRSGTEALHHLCRLWFLPI